MYLLRCILCLHCFGMSCFVSCDVMSCLALSCHAMPCYVVYCWIVFCYAMLCYHSRFFRAGFPVRNVGSRGGRVPVWLYTATRRVSQYSNSCTKFCHTFISISLLGPAGATPAHLQWKAGAVCRAAPFRSRR